MIDPKNLSESEKEEIKARFADYMNGITQRLILKGFISKPLEPEVDTPTIVDLEPKNESH